jgi:hypothetical protein
MDTGGIHALVQLQLQRRLRLELQNPSPAVRTMVALGDLAALITP